MMILLLQLFKKCTNVCLCLLQHACLKRPKIKLHVQLILITCLTKANWTNTNTSTTVLFHAADILADQKIKSPATLADYQITLLLL